MQWVLWLFDCSLAPPLCRGVIFASLSILGKQPSMNEALMNLTKRGPRRGKEAELKRSAALINSYLQ